jgi:hypothetical protein
VLFLNFVVRGPLAYTLPVQLVLKSRKAHGQGREVIYSVLIVWKLKPLRGQFQPVELAQEGAAEAMGVSLPSVEKVKKRE